jgi:Asp-tRNA(Asn)/Glu-tRNA(Gln) amidotransferase A subunit family amidase
LYFPDTAACQRSILEESGEPILPLTPWAFQYSNPKPISVAENWELNVKREMYRTDYHKLMKQRGVDFILSPTYLGVAAELGTAQYWNYTALWNILDQTCAVFPTGLFQDPKVDKVEEGYKPRNEVDERKFKKYTAEKFEGAPIALQITGKHFHDEATIAAAKVVAQIVQG